VEIIFALQVEIHSHPLQLSSSFYFYGLISFSLQDYCTGKEKQCFFNVFPKILHALYELDLVQEDAIWKWVDESKEDSSSKIFIKLVSR